MFYVICPPRRTDWHFDRELLIERLIADWPGVQIGGPEAALSSRDVVWSYSSDAGVLEGSQDRAGRAHYLDGPVSLVARYAAWWRGQVPPDQPLMLCDDGYNVRVNLDPDVTPERISEQLQG